MSLDDAKIKANLICLNLRANLSARFSKREILSFKFRKI